MKIFKTISLLFIFLLSSLSSQEFEPALRSIEDVEEYASTLDFNGLPSCIVENCVNVISGHYFESHDDIATTGPNSTKISRYYSTGNKAMGDFKDFWQLNLSAEIKVKNKGKKTFAEVDDRGVVSLYERAGCDEPFKLSKKNLKSGIVNTTTPYSPGNDYIINKSLHRLGSSQYVLKTTGGETLNFSNRQAVCCQPLLDEIVTPNGCKISYDYGGKKTKRVHTVTSYDRSGTKVEKLHIDRSKKRKVVIQNESEKEVIYNLEKPKTKSIFSAHSPEKYRLASIEKNFGPTIKYTYTSRYKDNLELLIKRSLPDHRFLAMTYEKSEKVSGLYAPAGVDKKGVRIRKFKYGKRKTSVFDACGFKKVYRWGKDKRLTSIEEFISKKEEPYRTEKFYWGKKGTPDHTFLKCRILEGADGNVLLAKTYRYNSNGCVLEERTAGNISGTCEVSPQVSETGDFVYNGCESYAKNYRYNEKNLLAYEQYDAQSIHYFYYPETALLRLKLLTDPSGIRLRYYYEYDDNAVMTLEIIDDGNTQDILNLSGVSERKIQRIQNDKKGLPVEVAHYYLDLTSNCEILIRRSLNTFKNDLLIKEKVYDSENKLATCKKWRYNRAGSVLEETDPLGHKTFYSYDKNGNCLTKQTPLATNRYVYDFSNRLIKEEILAEGEVFSKSHHYDHRGYKIQSSDIYGNVTRFSYDPLGRVIARELPPLPNGEGGLQTFTEKYKYDALNHPTKKQDANGQWSTMHCNIYGKPTFTKSPDGSKEYVFYYLNGTVKETVGSTGLRTVFEYDFLQRKTREEKISPQGESLSVRHFIYNAFHLIQEIDPEGGITDYRYDGAGRVISKKQGTEETLYTYDTFGREKTKKELYGEGEYRISLVDYDLLNRIIEERIENTDGKVFLKKQYAYDSQGNRTHQTICTNDGPLTTITRYNALKLPTKIIAPDGTETYYHYRFDFRDENGLAVPYQQIVDPLGNITTTVKNTHDSVSIQETKNIFGETVKKTRVFYDGLKHPLKRIEEIIVSGKTERTTITAFEYDLMGRETAVIEASDEPEQKITRRKYNLLGDISHVFKPDGVIIKNFYDALGRLHCITSSDNSVSIQYAYDRNDRIIAAQDNVEQKVTERTYDSQGRMCSEVLDHGAKMEYAYDRMGRLLTLTLPDQSEIRYGYDAGYLKEVLRGDQAHRYHYDLSGKLASSELMHGLGEITYQYDLCLRPIGIKSSYWRMQSQYDAHGNPKEVKQSDPIGCLDTCYGYDALHQIISEQGAENHTYHLDSLGNRIQKDEKSCSSNSLNQLMRQGDVLYSYDPNSNLIGKVSGEGSTYYHYDALDRLKEVSRPEENITYTYDPFHRRTKKVIEKEGQIYEERYLYQGDKEIAALDETGKIVQLRVMGVGNKGEIGAAVLFEINGASYIPLHDYRGNTAVLVNSLGGVAETYRYTAYGEESVYNSSHEKTLKPINPWRFSSKRVDPETGLSYFGRRYYDPESARWTTPDPLWFEDGANLYAYVKNRPTLFVDPTGLFLDFLFDTVAAAFEYISLTDFSVHYDGTRFSIVTTATAKMSLDKKSHRYKLNGIPYGPIHHTFCNGIFNRVKDSHGSF